MNDLFQKLLDFKQFKHEFLIAKGWLISNC